MNTPMLTEDEKDIIQGLWGIGLTVVPRVKPEELFDCIGAPPPPGMSYQWCDAAAMKRGWTPVRADRHPGIFAPYGSTDDITIDGLTLCERPRADVQAFHADAQAKARKNVDDWFDRAAAQGFAGGVTVLSEGSGGQSSDIREVGDKTIEDATKIPADLIPHLSLVFKVRDGLWEQAGRWWGRRDAPEYQRYVELSEQYPDWTRGQIMGAVLTPIAIENTRIHLATKGAQHDQAANTDQPTGGDAGADGSSGGSAEASAPAGRTGPSN